MPRRSSCGALLLGPFMVFLIMAGVAYYLLTNKVEQTAIEQAKQEEMQPASTTKQTVVLVFSNPLLKQDEALALDLPGKQVRELTPPTGFRASALARAGFTVQPLKDQSAYRLWREDHWNVALRTPTGQAYEDPVILGTFDADHVAILARTDKRLLLSVSRLGGVTPIAVIDETHSVRAIQGGRAWIVSYTPGEGIEQAPAGPSKLIRLTRSGVSTTAAESPGLIARVVPYGDDATVYAYATEQGTMTAVSGDIRWQGTGTPLVWTDEQTLLYADRGRLWQRHAASSTAEDLLPLAILPTETFVSSTRRSMW
ncbi:hypothetical protein KBA73_05485 [Patescibacteria group bacterium]|nr:hypothetical protein [Patescibacteria group bacterium]